MPTLITIAPDGAITRIGPALHGPQLLAVVTDTLRDAAPWMAREEAVRAALQVTRGAPDVTRVHGATGYRFRIETG